MKIEEVQEWIKKYLLTNDNKINSAKIKESYNWIEKNGFLDYKKFIIKNTDFLDNNCSFSQRIYHIINNKLDKVYCKECKTNEVKFLTFNKGYREYCLYCGNRIQGDKSKFKKTIKDKNKDRLNNIINIKKFFSKNEVIKIIPDYINKNNLVIWKQKEFINNYKLISSIIHHTKFIEYKKVTKLSDFNLTERIYCLLNDIKKYPVCLSCDNKTTFISFKKGYREYCSSKCAINKISETRIKTTENKIKDRLKEINCDLVNDYYGCKNGILVRCNKCNREFEFNFPCGSWIRNTLCPFCNDYLGRSQPEYEIIEFLKEFNVYTKQSNRKEIFPYELDIYLPDYKIAIEYNGLYWHSENQGKDKNYHLMKTELCNDNGIFLIHIFENEWSSNKDIIKSLILAKLGIFKERIYARKCIVKDINTSDKNLFLDNNHRQGADRSSVKLGLYYNDELVSVMTFGKRQISKKNVLELIRYCSKCNTQIIGGANKLFSYFKNNYWDGEDIYSYADRRWSNGKLYKILGFELSHISSPNYWYITKDYDKIYHRVSFQKHKLLNKIKEFNSELTEWENMKNNEWDRIWDSGNYVFIFKK